MTSTGQTPAGWYSDPSGSGQQRYWDGSAWTEHYAPGAAQAPPIAPPPPMAPPPPAYGQATYTYPTQGGPPPKQGMSGCLKVFLVLLGLAAVGGTVAVVAVVLIGRSVVNHLNTTVVGVAGRPATLPAGAQEYQGERKQDVVTRAGGTLTVGSISATTTNWAKASVDGADSLCGDVTMHRGTVSSRDSFDAVMQVAGDFTWELVTPSGQTVSYGTDTSSLSALNNYLTTNQSNAFNGKLCFPYPTEKGQFAVTWQPRLLHAQRLVWILNLT